MANRGDLVVGLLWPLKPIFLDGVLDCRFRLHRSVLSGTKVIDLTVVALVLVCHVRVTLKKCH